MKKNIIGEDLFAGNILNHFLRAALLDYSVMNTKPPKSKEKCSSICWK